MDVVGLDIIFCHMQQNCMCRLICGQYPVHNTTTVAIFDNFRPLNATVTLIWTQYSVFFTFITPITSVWLINKPLCGIFAIFDPKYGEKICTVRNPQLLYAIHRWVVNYSKIIIYSIWQTNNMQHYNNRFARLIKQNKTVQCITNAKYNYNTT